MYPKSISTCVAAEPSPTRSDRNQQSGDENDVPAAGVRETTISRRVADGRTAVGVLHGRRFLTLIYATSTASTRESI